MPGGLISGVDQAQFSSLLIGAGTNYEVISFQNLGDVSAVRVFKAQKPGGGQVIGRIEAEETTVTIPFEAWATTAAGLAAMRAAMRTAFAPGMDFLAWKLPGETVISYVPAYCDKATWSHTYESDVGLVLPVTAVFVVPVPTILTV